MIPTVLLSLAYRNESWGSWWLDLLQYLPYLVYLLPVLAALLLSLALGRVWRGLALLSVALVLIVIMGAVWGHADAGEGRVRLMTYNVKAYLAKHHDGMFDMIAGEVAFQDPDILVMQDAAELVYARNHNPTVAAVVFAGKEVFAADQYIVVSRYPLRDCQVRDLSYRDQHEAYVRCLVTAHGTEFELFTAHFLSPRRGLNATRQERADGIEDWRQNFNDRLAQSRTLMRDAASRQRPLIVAGDLNAPVGSPVLRGLLALGLRDAYSSAGLGYGYTYGHALRMRSSFLGTSFLRIDHILVSPEIGVADVATGGEEASEHRPVIADLLLHRAPG